MKSGDERLSTVERWGIGIHAVRVGAKDAKLQPTMLARRISVSTCR